MTTKYAPKLQVDTETGINKLKVARTDYLQKRQAFEKAYYDLQELRKTLASHRSQAEAANRQAEEAIRNAKGQETEESIGLQEMAIRKERQIRVVEGMIETEEPAVELLKIDTYGSRLTYSRVLEQARHAANFEQINEKAAVLFKSDAAAPLLQLLPSLMAQVEDNVFRDVGYMATHGVDISTIQSPDPKTILLWLSEDDRKEIATKVKMEQLAAIGDIVVKHIVESEDDALESMNELFKPIEPLTFEADRKEMSSGIAIAKRRKELIAALGEKAA